MRVPSTAAGGAGRLEPTLPVGAPALPGPERAVEELDRLVQGRRS